MNQLELAEKIACADALPVYKGVYRVYCECDDGKPKYAFWTGKRWSAVFKSARTANKNWYGTVCLAGVAHWQGLVKPPVGEWIDGKIKPVYPGVYERNGIGFAFWNGEFWGRIGRSAKSAAYKSKRKPSVWQDVEWRGLTEPIQSC